MQEFYTKIHKWLDDGGAKAVLHELLNRDISKNFDANAIAPKTPFLGQMSEAGEHPITQIIRTMFDEGEHPLKDDRSIIGSNELKEYLRHNNMLGRARINDVANALEQIGGRNLGQVRVQIDFDIIGEGTAFTKPTLYLIRRQDEFIGNTPQEIVAKVQYRPIHIAKRYN